MIKTEIEVKYPKAFKLLKDWVYNTTKQISGLSDKTMEMFPLDNIMTSILSTGQRQLYTFFDAHQVIMLPNMKEKFGEWSFITANTNIITDTQIFSSRELAEDKGFQECFKILEQKLN